jgi:prepilin-type N-terminal cleavage/methylation domain-containing protein
MRTQLTGKEAGFSLIELMIVVGLIGILTTMAIPRFQAFQAKAKMGEAKSLLTHIHTLQQSYHLDNNTYQDFAVVYGRKIDRSLNCTQPPGARSIGFTIEPCVAGDPVPRYGYQVMGATTAAFSARASTGDKGNNLVCPGDRQQVLQMDQAKQLRAIKGSLNGC